MSFPERRLRRLRRTPALRRLVAEHRVTVDDLVAPLFVKEGIASPEPVVSMPGVVQHTQESLRKEVRALADLGVPGIMLFGIPAAKDPRGSQADARDGVVQVALRNLRDEVGDEVVLMVDNCLDEYTDHGHCGLLTPAGEVDNDATLDRYASIAMAQADAGADVIAPSGMMDGQVAAIRAALDETGHATTAILAYAAKYASALYGPFRDAAECAPQFGDRRGYQMNPANAREAIAEVQLDVDEGADMVMVKPALAYLDVIADVCANVDVPVAAYHVSGEYAMVKAGAQLGWLDGTAVALEHLLAIKRSGAEIILTYFAREVAELLHSQTVSEIDWFARAQARIPGGVNSPVRAFGSVGGDPFFVARAAGSRIVDTAGNEYTDYVQSWGASILGHAHPKVVEAVQRAAADGTSFGAPTPREVELAEAICARVPSVEKVRLVSSGTEAAMTAVRLARGATGRDKIVKFAGCYHGHLDALLVQAGSGVATLGLPGSAGVTAGTTADTIVVPYNDLDALDAVLAEHGSQIAAILVEPYAANMGLVAPVTGFLDGLRARAAQVGALLVFDEVITGFRVALGGAQARFAITPDLSIFGKVIGGGLPLAAVGGRADVMDNLAPLGAVYQAGTLSGNPLATAAGLAVLAELDGAAYATLEQKAQRLADGLAKACADAGVAAQVTRADTLVGIFFAEQPVRNYADAQRADHARYAKLFHGLLDRGVFVAPSGYETLFPSLAHSDVDIDTTVAAFAAALS